MTETLRSHKNLPVHLFTRSLVHVFDVSFRASPSIVCPAVGGISVFGVLSSSVFMPSLKPFTAPPRSVPRLRSFLVPKIRTTTSKTISQCQMLNEPIYLLLCCPNRGGEGLAAVEEASAPRILLHNAPRFSAPRILLRDA